MSIESSINTFTQLEDNGLTNKDPVVFQNRNPKILALQDLGTSLTKWHMWMMLAYQDIKLRYRRSILGPFWITISMAVTAYSMGFLYGHLFKTNIASYFPYLVGGMISWALISNSILELTETFTGSEGLIKQIKLPYSLYIHKIAFRNIIVFLHNMVVIIPIFFIYHESATVNLYTLLLIPGLLLIYTNSLIFGLSLAMIAARYRDFAQIVKSLVQVIFFVTPVMWQPNALPPTKQIFVTLNPFNSLVDVIRAPLLGQPPSVASYMTVAIVTLVGATLTWHMFVKYRARIIYWL